MRTTWEEAGWEELGAGVGRRRMPGWDETVGAVVGATGVLIVDTGATLRDGARLRRELRGIAGRDVTHVALTHPHFDHVLGAAAFAGVQVFGAAGLDMYLPRAQEELRRDAVSYGVDPDAAAEATDLLVRPHHLVSGERVLDLGGRQVLLANVGPGHTAHDLVILVPGTHGSPEVVFCGDLVEESGEPQAGPDAVPGQWPAALDRLLALGGEDAVYVPGHGAVVDARFVRGQRDALSRRFGVSRR
ncbi:metallo-beta-lactamase [Streptomyces rimosus subsp. pseudoverticillatus]|uniref:MBL fold metallo-hydrolase n=1 Tax=Streptomyces rimosus TaxID=1927 RepID=UPI0006B25E3E|nr:MBL fold metallo-hydrolase [Streptomyces rimosus]KOT98912.1 metallo-beta-lactamase [Streptomyces rimosus subsp. pseudoverticillatus]